MATMPTYTATYRVTSLNESGPGRITVNLIQDNPDDASPLYTNPMSLNLTDAEAAGYFPGQTYTVTVAPTA